MKFGSHSVAVSAALTCAFCFSTPGIAQVIKADSQQPVTGRYDKIQQFGFTWTFQRKYDCGQFANGDWWVVGPVNVIGIDPKSTDINGRTMNGSMINPVGSTKDQGYDSDMFKSFAPGHFKQQLNVSLGVSATKPLVLKPGQTLISVKSVPAPEQFPQIQAGAVLTCVAKPPPVGSFRPPYAGAKKPLYNVSKLKWGLLKNLKHVRNTPHISTVAAKLERPWLDHIPDWVGRALHPIDNMPDYGREIADTIGRASLQLNLDYTYRAKQTLLIRFVQLGIDLFGIVESGGSWGPDGGHASGRKWPILFAGLMLGDTDMIAIGHRKTLFGEDAQTFYVEETSPGVYNYGHGGYTKDDVGMAEWGHEHAVDPSSDNKSWTADPYRRCCTANAWTGIVLAARIMDAQKLWNHHALFDYVDRYVKIEPPGWRRHWSDWTAAMWEAYR